MIKLLHTIKAICLATILSIYLCTILYGIHIVSSILVGVVVGLSVPYERME
jgi:hypothetical protein